MLEKEIDAAKRLVKTDAYQISVGEIVNMYRDGEMVINPDFQRLFRWEIDQKSKLIESLLLGIPIPSIFVFEKEDSTWELIDGLQRISTLLEFMGQLKDPDTGKVRAPTALVSTKYLPSLDNVVWEKSKAVADVSSGDQEPLPSSLQLAIRRSRLSVEILKRPSANETKYDLFQRLNAGGTAANAQELRNVIVITVNSDYARFMRKLAEHASFRTTISASDDQIDRQKDMEFVSRFLVHTYVPYKGKLDVEEFIDESIVELATAGKTSSARRTFSDTFDLLDEAYGKDALRRYQSGSFSGKVGLAAFEGIAVGIAKNISNVRSKTKSTGWLITFLHL